MSRRTRGFSLIEVLLVLALGVLMIGLLMNNSATSRANRECDQVATELKGALQLARKTATNQNGANVTLVLPNGATDGSWSVVSGSGATARTWLSARMSRTTEVVVTPTLTTIAFTPNGSTSTASCNITVRARRTNRLWTISVNQRTGAVDTSDTL